MDEIPVDLKARLDDVLANERADPAVWGDVGAWCAQQGDVSGAMTAYAEEMADEERVANATREVTVDGEADGAC